MRASPKGVGWIPQLDGEARTAVFVLTRGDRIDGHHEIVQPSGRGEPGLEGRLEDRSGFGETPAGVLDREVLEKPLGADPDPAS